MQLSTSPRPAYFTRLAVFFLTALAALALMGSGSRQAQAGTIYYVATPSVGDGSGSSWSNAGPLQPILSAAHMGDQVWVKAGVYIGNFTTVDGVAVYGHFIGTETSITQRPLTNMTSADTSYLDANNSGTVYTVPSAAIKINTLDGFTVENAAGRGVSDPSNDTLIVTNCTFSNNDYGGGGSGGGIYDDGLIATITDCTFTNNYATDYGGAIYIGSNTVATINGCTFAGNSSSYGGGIYSIGTITVGKDASGNKSNFTSNGGTGSAIYTSGSGATTIGDSTLTSNSGRNIDSLTTNNIISNCSFTDTTAGIDVTGTTSSITNCAFSNNDYSGGGSGAGIYDSSQSSTITGCTFTDNYATDYGGGIYVDSSTTVTISGCTFTGNSTSYGGGIYSLGTPTIVDCTFDSNSPDAIILGDTGTPSAHAAVKDCLIVGSGNTTSDTNGIDLGIDGNQTTFVYADVLNNTVVKTHIGINIGTTGGAVIVANNILYDDNVGLNGNSTITFAASHSDYYSNTHNAQGISLSSSDLTENPLFVDPTNGDYHLMSNSPCIDAGDDSYVMSRDTDLDSHARIQGRHVDIGCYEFVPPTYPWYATAVSAEPSGGSHLLWTQGNGVAGLWTLNAAGIETTIGPTYGPFPGYAAVAVASAPDGTSRVLWTNSTGQAVVWTFNAADVETAVGATYGPYTGWTAKSIGVAGDGTSRVLWTNVNGEAGVWSFGTNDAQTLVGPTYGPFTGWSAKSIATATDGTSRVLWDNANGEAGVWTFSAADVETKIGGTYGPFTGWTAKAVGVAGDGTSRVLWTNTNGAVGLWSFNTSGIETIIGPTYGPYAGYTATALGVASDGTSRVLWDKSDRSAGVWTFGANDMETVIGPTYGPY